MVLSGLISRPVDVDFMIRTVTVNVNRGWVGAAFRYLTAGQPTSDGVRTGFRPGQGGVCSVQPEQLDLFVSPQRQPDVSHFKASKGLPWHLR